MDKIKKYIHHVRLAFSKSGLGYVVTRIPSMVFWSTICTGLLIGGQYLYFSFLPSNYFFSYESPAKVSNVMLGQTPVLEYCRKSIGNYPIIVNANIRKVEPPVYTQQYQVKTDIPQGQGCLSREVADKPTVPGEYKIFYTVKATLPFGVEKYATFETDVFNVGVPDNLYGDYSLTVDDTDSVRDGKAHYAPDSKLQYTFKATALVEYFGTTERHIICGQRDYFIDSYSGRTTAGDKDTINNTTNVPSDAYGTCHLELRIKATVGDSKDSVSQVLTSNTFVVQ